MLDGHTSVTNNKNNMENTMSENGYRRGFFRGVVTAIGIMRILHSKGFGRTTEIANILDDWSKKVIEWERDGGDENDADCKLPNVKSWSAIRYEVMERDGFKCFCCPTTYPLHIHHLKPVKNGGCPDVENLLTLCKECHAEAHRDM